jgi:hypothetical protein
MHYYHLYSDDAGESHWRDVSVSLAERTFAPPAKAIEISDGRASVNMLFLRLSTGWNEPQHPTPVRQTLICLRGCARVTASDGDTRDIGAGDVWLMEDVGGKGHHTRVISDEDWETVVVQHP